MKVSRLNDLETGNYILITLISNHMVSVNTE